MARRQDPLFAVSLAACLLTTGARSFAQQSAPSPPVALPSVLEEALPATMDIDNRGLRSFGLLEIARIRQRDDEAAALELAQRVARILPDLPEDETWGDFMRGFFNPLNLLNIVATTAAYGPQVSTMISENRANVRRQYLYEQYRKQKATLTQDLFELMVPHAPDMAVKTEATLRPAYRVLAIEALLRLGPAADAERLVAIARDLSVTKNKDIPSYELGMLAEAVNRYNPSAARVILDESLRKIRGSDVPDGLMDAIYERAIRIEPVFDFDPAVPAADKRVHAQRQLAYARAAAAVNARQALSILNAVTHDGSETRQGVAAALRAIAAAAPESLWPDIRQAALRSMEDGAKRSNYLINRDAIVALGYVDPALAAERADRLVTKNTRVTGNAVRLELALSWLPSRRSRAFQILESLEDQFWKSLAESTWKMSSMSQIKTQTFSAIVRAKREWPLQAAAAGGEDLAAASRTLRRFTEIARILDSNAVKHVAKHVNDHEQLRRQWIDYLPLALADAAAARQKLSDPAAHAVFEESYKVASTAKSPAREWAYAWNAAAWHQAGPTLPSTVVDRIVSRLVRFDDHGKLSRDFPMYVEQVTRFSPPTALRLARARRGDQRAMGLIAVAWELHGQPGR
ncbi:MAG TPA: hypothetical protein VH679_02065 [Vicinamibacterales bacterium]|jgi:hypothetical protein